MFFKNNDVDGEFIDNNIFSFFKKYKIRIPYFNGGKSYSLGAEGDWGTYKHGVDEYRDKEYFYDGLDCMGFVTWAYVNAGYDIINSDNKY